MPRPNWRCSSASRACSPGRHAAMPAIDHRPPTEGLLLPTRKPPCAIDSRPRARKGVTAEAWTNAKFSAWDGVAAASGECTPGRGSADPRGDRVKAPSNRSARHGYRKARAARGRLFRKYVGLFLAVVCIALLTNGIVRNLVLLSGAQGFPHPHPARAGRGGGGQDQPVHQGDREPGRMDHATAVVGRHHRPAAF